MTLYIQIVPNFLESIAVLSVLNSWEALRKPIRSTNYNRLKSFQGFRVIIMCVVIACHSMAGTIFAYTTNVKLLEDVSTDIDKKTMAVLIKSYPDVSYEIIIINQPFSQKLFFRNIVKCFQEN